MRYKTNTFTSIFQYHLKRFINKSLVLIFTWPGAILQENTAILLLVLASNLDNHSSQSIFKAQDVLNRNTKDSQEKNTDDIFRMKTIADYNIVRVENVINKEIAIIKIIFKE
jgi:hypothetical protein